MKIIKLIVCTAIIAFTFTAFINVNWNDSAHNKASCQSHIFIEPPTFLFKLSSPGQNTVSKERMHNAKNVSDLIPDHKIQVNLANNNLSVRDVKIRIEEENVHPSEVRSEKGTGNSLTNAQIDLLNTTDYATNFTLEGFITPNKDNTDLNKDRYFAYYMTVTPEHEASYKSGTESFINFITTNCQPTIAKVQHGNLRSGSISFTVTKAGTISNIYNNSSCGYPSVDKRIMQLMNNLPEVWNVAADSNGEKVNQNFVFSYGQMGC